MKQPRDSSTLPSRVMAACLTVLLHVVVFAFAWSSGGFHADSQSVGPSFASVLVSIVADKELTKLPVVDVEAAVLPNNVDELQSQSRTPQLVVEEPIPKQNRLAYPGLPQNTPLISEEELKWAAVVREAIQKVWIRAGALELGGECKLALIQDGSGHVLGARMQSCNTDDPVRESLLAAIYRASPLPVYPGPRTANPNELRFFLP